jgi:hypothetical protein
MSSSEKSRLATKAGISVTQAAKMSGADLHQAALAAAAGTSVGAGKDGATLMRLAGGPA